MRVAIVYDCLFPHTVGGAERWYRHLAERLARRHEVTYVTRRQWSRDEKIDVPAGVAVVAVSGGEDLYTSSGRRKVSVPIRFGLGLFWHLIRNRRTYDVVHTCAFPYFSVIAARVACAGSDTRVVVDWFEVWSRDYWREYLGKLAGPLGHRMQRLCVRLTRRAFVFSNLHRERLLQEGLRRPPVLLPGLYWGRQAERVEEGGLDPDRRKVLFAGRMIPEKCVTAIPPAVRLAHERDARISATILGDGPDRHKVMDMVSKNDMSPYVEVPGFVESARVEQEMRGASMLLLPSRREGYGAVVIEAASFGTPSIVVAHPDNSAVELIEPGQNGIVVSSDSPDDLATAILDIAADPNRWRVSTLDWFQRHAEQISVNASVEIVETTYRQLIDDQDGAASLTTVSASASNG